MENDDTEFCKAIERLGANVGMRKDVLSEKISLFKEEFGRVPLNIWKRTCHTALVEMERFPTIHQLREIINGLITTSQERVITVSCNMCGGSGYVSAIKIINDRESGDYAFACNCEAGMEITGVPRWHERWRQQGYMPRDDFDMIDNKSDYTAPREEQQKRMVLLKKILNDLQAGNADEVKRKAGLFDEYIDTYRAEHRKAEKKI